MNELTNNEKIAIGIIFDVIASQEGEDIIGVLMKNGCFKHLPDKQLVDLSDKIEDWIKLNKNNVYFNKRF